MAAIRAEFGYSEADDRAAALELHAQIPKTNRWRELGPEIRNRATLAIVGCGPSLDRLRANLFVDKVVIAADGATERLQEIGVVPHVVVTDLDGRMESLEWAASQGARMIVHAHGDNRRALAKIVPKLGPQVYGSHQVEPLPSLAPMENPGGFTDGDRAVVICEHLGARRAMLLAYEFTEEPSRYSHQWNPATKGRKLAHADAIVAEVHARGKLALQKWMP